MASTTDDFDDIDTDASREPVEAPQLCAMISIDGVVTSVPLPARGDFTIGRGSTCDLVVQHASVSRHHATLRMSPLEIMDAGSRNGTRVRGVLLGLRVATAIEVGEAVQIGEAAILIQPATLAGVELASELPPPPDSIARMLDMECARSARSRSPFAYVRLETREPRADMIGLLRAILRTSDAVGSEGQGSYQVLLLDTNDEQAALALSRMTQLLGQHGISAKLGVARYPRDGVTAEQLTAHAWEQLDRTPGDTPSEMDAVRELIAQISTGDVSVLITGETGVGKELCAEMVHRLSARASRPFVKLNCSAIVETLIESELFGHERGAFTGATHSRAGLMETGDGGTVFLDEIGELPLGVQSKLLRVLEERVVRRVGATTGKTLDVRFICATNRDLADEVDAGRFRRDLYYRINGVTLSIPPLRERVPEIAGLARAFARRTRAVVLGPEVVTALEQHTWPGNIRELKNTIERAVLLSSGGSVRPSHLAIESSGRVRRSDVSITAPVDRISSDRISFSEIEASPPNRRTLDSQTLATAVADLERQRIVEVLNQCGGNQTRAARMLGISRNTLLARLDAYGFPRPRKP
ncbi:MAG: sigma 54-interacting transcriptional regulator [Deltaproteobacteria bacterium]|nr:sigma 54-interacting transcriptional regulator [Deltaproteobacteria bacterium]